MVGVHGKDVAESLWLKFAGLNCKALKEAERTVTVTHTQRERERDAHTQS